MTSFPIDWSRQRRDAGHYLNAASGLAGHFRWDELVTLRHADHGPDEIHDLEAIDTWAWSGGERVLVNLFLTLAGFTRDVQVRDLLALDPENRNAAGNAISMACSQGWHPSTQSYLEAF